MPTRRRSCSRGTGGRGRHRPLSSVSLGVAMLAVMLVGPVAARPSPIGSQFRTTVDLVQLQVGIADADGRFVPGLTAEDFRVRVDGQERRVQTAYEVNLNEEGQPSPTPNEAEVGVGLPAAARRHFILFFDLSFLSRRGLLRAREAALEFLRDGLHGDDLIAIATMSPFGFELLVPFTPNHEQAAAAVGSLRLGKGAHMLDPSAPFEDSIREANPEMADVLATGEYRAYLGQVSVYTRQMAEIGRLLQAIEGRKNVLWFSRGFEDLAFTGDDGAGDVLAGLDELIDEFRAADAVLHAVEPKGLSETGGHNESLSAMASGTGGTIHWNMNDLGRALGEVERATAAYYMIGYQRRDSDRPVVDLEVRIVRPDVRVTWAPRKLAPPPRYEEMSDAQRQLQLAEALADESDWPGLEFRMEAIPVADTDERGELSFTVEIPRSQVRTLAAARGDDRVELEMLGVALDDAGGVVAMVRRGVAIDVRTGRSEEREPPVRVTEELEVPPGAYRLRVLLREAKVGHLTTRTILARLSPPRGA